MCAESFVVIGRHWVDRLTSVYGWASPVLAQQRLPDLNWFLPYNILTILQMANRNVCPEPSSYQPIFLRFVLFSS